jgi:hypothetical protein
VWPGFEVGYVRCSRFCSRTAFDVPCFCRQLNCPIIGCGAKLKGLQDLESHYKSRHTATCSVCSRVFPTTRLLNFHVSETHDSFFQAKVARNYPMVLVLLDTAPSKVLCRVNRITSQMPRLPWFDHNSLVEVPLPHISFTNSI